MVSRVSLSSVKSAGRHVLLEMLERGGGRYQQHVGGSLQQLGKCHLGRGDVETGEAEDQVDLVPPRSIPVRIGDVFQPAEVRAAGEVKEDVDPAELAPREVDERRALTGPVPVTMQAFPESLPEPYLRQVAVESASNALRSAQEARLMAARVDSLLRRALSLMKSWIVPLKRTDVVGTPASRSLSA